MCGLAGMISLDYGDFPKHPDLETFKNLFVTSQLRGPHSSGVAGFWRQNPAHANKDKKRPRHGVMLYKGLDDPIRSWSKLNQLVNTRSKRNENTHTRAYYSALIAHSRHATVGTVTEDNAHPFCFGNNRFIGTHNGTINEAHNVWIKIARHKLVPREGTIAPDHDYSDPSLPVTDSERVLFAIYRYGIDQIYWMLYGAWAFVYYDELTKSVYFIRNRQRTLHYGWSWATDSLFWSSEQTMLTFGLLREQRAQTSFRTADFLPDTLYVLDVSKPQRLRGGEHNNRVFAWTSERKVKSVCPFPQEITNWWGQDKNNTTGNGINSGKTHTGTRTHFSTRGVNRSIFFEIDSKKPLPGITYNQDTDNLTDEEDDKRIATSIARTLNCVHCGRPHEKGKDVISLRNQGDICYHCYTDRTTMEEISETYVETSNNAAFIQQWLLLCNQSESEGDVHVA